MARGIVRKIDELGRVTLPKELRDTFQMKKNQLTGIYLENRIINLVGADEDFYGLARNLDDLGRLTIPKEIRTSLGFSDNQKVDIWVSGYKICIQKYVNGCEWCGSTEDLFEVDGHFLCRKHALMVADTLLLEG